MVYHGEKCRHCRANMSEPKLVTDGPKKGTFRTYCINCGHIEFLATGGSGSHVPQQQQQPQPQARPVGNPFQPVLIKRAPYS